ncbi:MAG TPA: OmpH family outer membrane protein [Pirellulales bacterium]|nr:OmpH family outer membrane protein [Pirellulales bacterium]
MRIKYLLSGAALAVLAFAVLGRHPWLEGAQDPVLFRPSSRVALVDLTRVFAEHEAFKGKIEVMRREVEEAEKELKARREEFEKAQANLEKDPAGSVKRAEAEQKVLLDKQTLEFGVKLQKAKFMEQEARLYADTYESVLAIIDAYAAEQKIDLVLRFNGDKPDLHQDLQSVMQHLNRQVLYHKGIDITDEILRRANAK